MAVSDAIGQEALLLGVSMLLGAGLFFLYDVLRILRRLVPHGNIWIGIEDFVYWLVCTGAIFVMLYRENDGMMRGYSLGGIVVGMLLYFLTLSRYVIRLHVLVLKAVTGTIGRGISFLSRPFRKISKKVWLFFRKQLKKVWKAVKMGLCKL